MRRHRQQTDRQPQQHTQDELHGEHALQVSLALMLDELRCSTHHGLENQRALERVDVQQDSLQQHEYPERFRTQEPREQYPDNEITAADY